MIRHRTTAAVLFVLLLGWALPGSARAAVPRIVFPVVAKTVYTNDFGDPRGSGSHQGNDLMARKKSPVVAAEAGRVSIYNRSARAGCMVYLYGRSGTTYMYIHLNNDRTMRNDNRGGCRRRVAYAPNLRPGRKTRVAAGQLLGYVGDSGDANGVAAHLHFEVHPHGRGAVSPYRRLRAGRHLLFPRPPASTSSLGAVIRGRVLSTVMGTDSHLLRLGVRRVRLSTGHRARPRRRVVITVPATAPVERSGGAGAVATTLESARVGERVTVWTEAFSNTLGYARAPAGRHLAARVLLRGV
jgi:Peptidase family M23